VKKAIILVLSAVLMLTVFAGCGNSSTPIAEVTDPVTVVIPAEPITPPEEHVTETVLMGTVITQNTGANVRAAASTDAEVIGTLDRGATVRVLEAGEWCRIEYGDGEGYVFGELLEVKEQVVGDEEEPGTPTTEDGNDIITRVVDD